MLVAGKWTGAFAVHDGLAEVHERPVVPLAIGAPPVSEIAGEGLEKRTSRSLLSASSKNDVAGATNCAMDGAAGAESIPDKTLCDVVLGHAPLQSVCPPRSWSPTSGCAGQAGIGGGDFPRAPVTSGPADETHGSSGVGCS